jgi:two-component system, sensor histidine kinase RegB
MFTTPVRPWLIRLRLTSAVIEASIALLAWGLPDLELPLRRVALILAAAAASNVAVAAWLSSDGDLPAPVAAGGLAIDALLLTALLELTGGPFNPFVVVYAVQIVIAVVTLGAVYAWPIALFAAACYSIVVYWHLNELVPDHHRVNDFPTHLFAMWMLLAAGAELTAFFVSQASKALAEREAALEAMRLRAARSEHLVSLTTLAAGAAHELSTPLGTIALAARELEHAIGGLASADALAEDARLIRTEVERCRAILDQMSGRAGGVAEDLAEEIQLSAVLDDIRAGLPSEQAARLRINLPDRLAPVQLPRAGLRQAVLTLIKNACEASRDEVSVSVVQRGGRVNLTVRDQGPPVAAAVLDRAGDPFFTTKEPGRGIGLGLFLARIFAERLGGTVTLQSVDGTIASLDLPMRSGTT